MSMKTKFFLAFTIMSLIVLTMFVSTVIITQKQKTDGLVINLAGRQRMLTQKMSKELLTFMLAFQKEHTTNNKAIEQLESTRNLFQKTLVALRDGGEAPITADPNGKTRRLPSAQNPAKEQLQKVDQMWKKLRESIDQVIQNQDEQAFDFVMKNNVRLLEEMNKAVLLFQEQTEAKTEFKIYTQAIGIILFIPISIFLFLTTSRQILRPISNLGKYANEITHGNLDTSISGEYKAELLTLKKDVMTMVESLKENLKVAKAKEREATQLAREAQSCMTAMKTAQRSEQDIKILLEQINDLVNEATNISRSVTVETEDLTKLAINVNNASQLQRDRLSVTSTAMDEMNATVIEVARNAGQASDSAGKAKEKASEGADVIKKAIDAISNLNALAGQLNTDMNQLGGKAESITRVINVINDIADQTNLLALNAAIEAARAGEAGRGFAVVADEVRKLAEKTMLATLEVTQSIKDIQNAVQTNMNNMGVASQATQEVSELAYKSGTALKTIVDLISNSTDQIEIIAKASEEQSQAFDEINRAITEVSGLAVKNAQGMDQASLSIQQLSHQAITLNDLITNIQK